VQAVVQAPLQWLENPVFSGVLALGCLFPKLDVAGSNPGTRKSR
jgi:hypothetical protein